MKSLLLHLFIPILLLLTACGKQAEKYVEITSTLPDTKVYFKDKYIGNVPIKLTESKLKELGLTYPYSIRNGRQLWEAWDIDQITGSAITVQNDPNSKLAGIFRFQAAKSDPQYRTIDEGASSWLVFQLGYEPIGDMPPHELGRRLTAIPAKVEQGAAANP